MNLLSCGPKALKHFGNFGNFGRHFPRYIRKNPRSMYARVPHGMAQFVLKLEKLSHIIGTTPIYRFRPA